MSEDNLLPEKLNSCIHVFSNALYLHHYLLIIVSLMILWTFADLLIIDVTVYGAGLSLEYIALIKLRIKRARYPSPI